MDKRFKITKILIINFIFLLLFALYIDKCWAYGFDSATSCSPNMKQSRKGRAQILTTIPCDLTKQAYCALPGAAYPWHAVRRFVHENQGLMKRMYGDVRHIAILKNEILNNEIDIDDIEMASERYSRDAYRDSRSMKFTPNRDDFNNFKSNDVLREAIVLNSPSTTAATTISTSIEANKSDHDLENVTTTFRTSSKAPTIDNGPAKEVKDNKYESTTVSKDLNENLEITTKLSFDNNDEEITTIMVERKGDTAANSVYDALRYTSVSGEFKTGDNIHIVESPQLAEIEPGSTSTNSTTDSSINLSTTATTAKATTTAKPTPTITTAKSEIIGERIPLKQLRKPFIPSSQRYRPSQQLLKVNSTISAKLKLKISPTESSANRTYIIRSNQTAASSTDRYMSTVPGTTTSASPTQTSTVRASPFKYNKNYNRLNTSYYHKYGGSANPAATSLLPSHAELLLGEKVRKPAILNVTPSSLVSPHKPLVHDGQLFQDAMKQDPPVHMRGVNACPVKEEVVAPFWANNTRGEVLALLNLYPFEQYVHWEKCTHEHKQMYCREGCRCEQQYRLHRLLAYDPNNECRGIFSDWFRFPSCCICKCYNIPFDFRTTSRSPRSEGGYNSDTRHPIEIAEEKVKNAIYEHATEEWYKPKDDFNFYEG
ncbi:spaetzle domain-containing protein 4 isoform 1-T1 [Glossina fuscipes fuscipes]